MRPEFPCIMCDAPDREIPMFWSDTLRSWKCPLCSFAYTPRERWGVPKKYAPGGSHPWLYKPEAKVEFKRMCLDCRRREVKGKAKYCEVCAKSRKRLINRKDSNLAPSARST